MNALSDYEDSWGWFLNSQQFRDLLAKAIDTPIDHKLIMGDGIFADHTFGCAFAQRGGVCDCSAADEGDEYEAVGWVQDGPVVVDWSHRNPFAAEIGRAMSRGFDYSALAGGFDEGIHDDEEGEQ